MAISFFNIKKWWRMLRGKSILHVNQGIGTCYSVSAINGYYNDMTEKVTKNPQKLCRDGIPLTEVQGGEPIVFPVCVFQYGLGCYDLFLNTQNTEYREKFLLQCTWALENQNEDGSWAVFEYECPQHPYGSMAQGEGASLLLRAYVLTNDSKYLSAAKKAVYFMIKDVNDGGTLLKIGDRIYLKEFTHKDVVYNGWIFSIWGLYDYLLLFGDDALIRNVYEQTVRTLSDSLRKMDNGYWSMYDMKNKIASPFYHDLHIAQLKVMAELSGDEEFLLYADKFKTYQSHRSNRIKAFVKKAWQKVTEK